jgi:putative oligomerization/nucleic acid binding protein
MGLIRGMARTAAVVGTATAVSGRVQRRQQNRWEQQENAQAYEQQQAAAAAAPPPQYAAPAPAPAPAAPSSADTIEQLTKLADLKAAGILTDAEFEAQKAKIIAGV